MKQLLLTIIICCCLWSCKKFVTVSAPPTELNTDVIFTTKMTADAAINGLYYTMTVAQYNNQLSFFPALSADEIVASSSDPKADPFSQNSLLSTNADVAGLWNLYGAIYQANACIAGLTGSALDTATVNHLSGEAKFVRAINYFYLTNLFGDVPIVTGTDYTVNATLARSPADKVYELIIQDLKEAVTLMPAAYPKAARVRANRYAAMALLSRVYLYRKDWANAELWAGNVIAAAGTYQLETNLSNVFSVASREAILQLAPSYPGGNAWDATVYVPYDASVIPNYLLTASLLNSFDTVKDLRWKSWIGKSEIGGSIYYYPNKYTVAFADPAVEYQTVIRLSEMYLIRAESRANRNNFADAVADINTLRTRAGVDSVSGSTQAGILALVEKERRLELAFEFGHRWFDLKRTGRADQVLGSQKTDWQKTDTLYPVPQTQRLLNKALSQNEGYN